MSPLPPQPLSPLDGRYRPVVERLGEHLSEAGLNRARIRVEVEWLIALTDRRMFGSEPLTPQQGHALRDLVTGFDESEIDELAQIEASTRHDVKAVEYLVRRRLTELGLTQIAELEREHGPVPPETLEWAAQLVDDWAAASRPRGRSRQAG